MEIRIAINNFGLDASSVLSLEHTYMLRELANLMPNRDANVYVEANHGMNTNMPGYIESWKVETNREKADRLELVINIKLPEMLIGK